MMVKCDKSPVAPASLAVEKQRAQAVLIVELML